MKFVILSTLFTICLVTATPNAEDKEWVEKKVSATPWAEVMSNHRRPNQLNPTPQPARSWLDSLSNWWTWDHDTVKNGIFNNDNIMIHVGQNLFNFVFTTLAWFTVSQIYSAGTIASRAGWGRGLSLTEAAEDVFEGIKKYQERR